MLIVKSILVSLIIYHSLSVLVHYVLFLIKSYQSYKNENNTSFYLSLGETIFLSFLIGFYYYITH